MINEPTGKIQARVTTPSPSQRELEVEVDPVETALEFEKILTDYASRAGLPGFRRGKAPKDMVKRLFYSEIKDAVIEALAPRALRESLRAERISPVGSPVIRDVSFKEGEPFRFKAVVEVLPEFELPPYKKIKVKKREVAVGEDEIEHSLEELRQKSAAYVPAADRGVVDGDYVVAEWKGRDLKTKRLMPTEKVLVLAGHQDNEKALNEHLGGLRPQETCRFVITYRADHAQKKLAGRTIEYEVRVISIKEKRVPELSDEWAKDLGEYENLSALREKIRQELLKAKEENARMEMGEEIVGDLLAKLDIEIPESLLAEEMQALLRRWASSLPREIPAGQVEELKQKARAQAGRNIKESLVLTKLAEREKLAVSDEEIEEEIKSMAKKNNIPLAQLIENIHKEGRREDLRNSLRLRKAIDFLLQNAVLY
jgi:trigger factor